MAPYDFIWQYGAVPMAPPGSEDCSKTKRAGALACPQCLRCADREGVAYAAGRLSIVIEFPRGGLSPRLFEGWRYRVGIRSGISPDLPFVRYAIWM